MKKKILIGASAILMLAGGLFLLNTNSKAMCLNLPSYNNGDCEGGMWSGTCVEISDYCIQNCFAGYTPPSPENPGI